MVEKSLLTNMAFFNGREIIFDQHGVLQWQKSPFWPTWLFLITWSSMKLSIRIDFPVEHWPVNWSEMRLNSSCMAVVFPMNVADIFRPRGGISQTAIWRKNMEKKRKRKRKKNSVKKAFTNGMITNAKVFHRFNNSIHTQLNRYFDRKQIK